MSTDSNAPLNRLEWVMLQRDTHYGREPRTKSKARAREETWHFGGRTRRAVPDWWNSFRGTTSRADHWNHSVSPVWPLVPPLNEKHTRDAEGNTDANMSVGQCLIKKSLTTSYRTSMFRSGGGRCASKHISGRPAGLPCLLSAFAQDRGCCLLDLCESTVGPLPVSR